MASSLVQQMRAGGRTAQELKTAVSLTNDYVQRATIAELDGDAISVLYTTSSTVLAFAGLNITGGRTDGVII